MSGLAETSAVVRRTIVVSIVLYFVVFGYAVVSGDPLAALVAGALFGIIAVGVGALLYRYEAGERTPLRAAAVLLVVGGLAQFGLLATGDGRFDAVSTVAVFVGIGIYLFAGRAGEKH